MNEKSSTDKLRQAATGVAVAKRDPQTFPEMLNAYGAQIAVALPKHLTKERMIRIALTAFRNNPDLAECDPKSVFACVVMSAQLGLEIGILGQSFLVPYNDRRKGIKVCQLIPGWQGLQDLVNRSGRASTWTGAVYEGDEFSYRYGASPDIVHVPCGEDDERKMTHTYAVGRVRGSEWPVIEVWPVLKLKRHRDKYNRQGDRHYSYREWEMYARKIPLLQVFKYVPKSVEMATILSLEHTADAGQQQISLEDAVRGTYISTAIEQGGREPEEEATDEKDQEETTLAAQGIMEDDAILLIKSAADLPALDQAWKQILYHSPNGVTINIEAARNDRREFIKARDEKAKK